MVGIRGMQGGGNSGMEGQRRGAEPGPMVGIGREDFRRGTAEGEGNSCRGWMRGIQEASPVVRKTDSHGTAGTQAEGDEARAGKDGDGGRTEVGGMA
eukprot:13371316-Alexandrium_andersonii.AAC.1